VYRRSLRFAVSKEHLTRPSVSVAFFSRPLELGNPSAFTRGKVSTGGCTSWFSLHNSAASTLDATPVGLVLFLGLPHVGASLTGLVPPLPPSFGLADTELEILGLLPCHARWPRSWEDLDSPRWTRLPMGNASPWEILQFSLPMLAPQWVSNPSVFNTQAFLQHATS
jgi:hypothetical protein